LHKNLTNPDATLAHAAQQALRRSGNWPAVLELLDGPDADPLRPIALRALADQATPEVADGLIRRLEREASPPRRQQYADLLTRIHRKPGPWKYWGYRPPPRPADTTAWERTEPIAVALNGVLTDSDPAVRLAVLRRMQREQVPTKLDALAAWLRQEQQAERLGAILAALREHPAAATDGLLEELVVAQKKPAASRLDALQMLAAGLTPDREGVLLRVTKALEDGPVLVQALQLLGRRPGLAGAVPLIHDKLASADAAVRAAAVETLTGWAALSADFVLKLLDDPDTGVRRAAASAAGKLGIHKASPLLLKYARRADPALRAASLEALCRLEDRAVLPRAVAALAHPVTHSAALQCISELGGPEYADAIAESVRHHPPGEPLLHVIKTLDRWHQARSSDELREKMAELQGASGLLARWAIVPVQGAAAEGFEHLLAMPERAGAGVVGAGVHARIMLPSPTPHKTWAVSRFDVAEPMAVQFLAGSNVPVRAWLNGKSIYERKETRPFQVDSERFLATLNKGTNHLLLELGQAKAKPEFHVHFRRVSTKAEHESLVQAALSRPGNAERGRKIFLDTKRSQCLSCHRLGNDGERIGPELTGVGSRFARVYLIESILEPSRAIAPSYQTLVVSLKNGRSLQGVKIEENEKTVTLADQKGEKHALVRADIDETHPSPLSTMPEGLERQLSADEFVDLIAFLVSQKT
jgi:putative heme-binding domain-containing protein